MINFTSTIRLVTSLMAITAMTSAMAQDQAGNKELKPLCDAVAARVLVSKVGCSAAQCSTAPTEGGFVGLLTKVANKGMGAIDAASFSASMGSQLATALKQTGCFEVLDAASIEEIKKEMEALGKPAPPPQQFDYLVKATITKADILVEESGMLIYKKTTATSTLALDTKLIRADNGSVVEAAIFDASVQRISSGVSVGAIYSSGDDAAKKGTPYSDVGREVTAKAAIGLATKAITMAGAAKTSAPN